jgi:hypothetical protein
VAVVIGQIVTEAVVAPTPADASAGPSRGTQPDEAQMDAVVRRATERVLETLRREWDR